jgi:hypothetical protein
MMAVAHAAVGAAIGHVAPSAPAAAALGFVAHGLLDLPRHQDLDLDVELVLTAGALTACGILFGLRRPEFWGAVGCAAPDLEHLPPFHRPRKLFPTHRWSQLHEIVPTPRISAGLQLAGSAALVALLAWRVRG